MSTRKTSKTRVMSPDDLIREMHSPSVSIEQRVSDLRSPSARVKAQAFALVSHCARVRKDPWARQALIDAMEHGWNTFHATPGRHVHRRHRGWASHRYCDQART